MKRFVMLVVVLGALTGLMLLPAAASAGGTFQITGNGFITVFGSGSGGGTGGGGSAAIAGTNHEGVFSAGGNGQKFGGNGFRCGPHSGCVPP
jgi:hypothetical protein